MDQILISTDDARALSAILGNASSDEAAELFAEAFNGAEVVVPAEIPRSVVGLYDSVEYAAIDSGLQRRVTLVPPDKIDLSSGRISVLSPVGRALFGRAIGARTEVLRPEGDALLVQIIAVEPRDDG